MGPADIAAVLESEKHAHRPAPQPTGTRRRGSLRRTTLTLAALPALAALSPLARAQVDARWLGTTDGRWSTAANWDTTPAVPNAPDAVAHFVDPAGATAVTLDVPVTLAGLTFDTGSPYKLSAGTGTAAGSLTLAGPATVDVRGPTYQHPVRFPSFGQTIPGVAGDAGLAKTGAGTLILGGPSTYRGTTRVLGGTLSISSNSALGDAGNDVLLDGGALRLSTNGAYGINRAITLGAAGGRIELQTAASGQFSGVISGPGSLTIGQLMTDTSVVMTAYLWADNTYTGPTYVLDQQVKIGRAGAVRYSSAVESQGTIILDNGEVAGGDRLPDTAPVILRGGQIQLLGNASAPVVESAGPLVLEANTHGGLVIIRGGSNQATALRFASVERRGRATLEVHGTETANRLYFGSGGPALAGDGPVGTPTVGVVPWAVADSGTAGYERLTTYDPVGGLRELAPGEYVTALPAAGAPGPAPNVVLSQSTAVTAPTTVNALDVRSANNAPVWVDITGTAPIRVTSGAVAVGARLANVAAPLDFGDAEGVIHGAYALNLSSVISGRNGVTFANGDVRPTGRSTYTGQTVIACGISLSTDVIAGQPGPFGADTSPVLLVGGQVNAAAVVFHGTNRLSFTRDLAVTSNTHGLAHVGVDIDYSSSTPITLAGNITLDAGSTLEVQDKIDLGGRISGPGSLYLTGARHTIDGPGNDYAGGTTVDSGTLVLAADHPLGTGPVTVAGSLVLTASGGARSLPNAFDFNPNVATSLSVTGIGGTFPVTIGGPVRLNGNVTVIGSGSAAAPLEFAGPVSDGALSVTGGTVVLSAANTLGGRITVTGGATLRVAHAGALGSPAQPTLVFTGGVLELDGGAAGLAGETEPLQLAQALHSLRGNNTWAGPVSFSGGGTAVVTVDVDSLTLPPATTLSGSLTKQGPGLLRMVNVRGGALSVEAGRLAIAAGGAAVAGASRVTSLSVGAGATLDLADHVMLVDYAGASPAASVRSLLAAGRVTSSTAAPGAAAVGYAEAAVLLALSGTQTASYQGQAVDATTLVLLPTLAGDANLDGRVNFDDLLLLAKNYNGTNGAWSQGDFTYDGTVNFDDLLVLAKDYGAATPAPGVPDAPAGFAADVSAAFAGVPEPSVAAGLAVSACGLLAGRARRRRSARA